MLADMIQHVQAGEKLLITQAVHLGYLNAREGKNTQVQSHTRALERLAVPRDHSATSDDADAGTEV